MTAEERVYRHAETYDEWLYCKRVYDRSDAIWASQFRMTTAIQQGLEMPAFDEMRRDMLVNRCHSVLRKVGYWG